MPNRAASKIASYDRADEDQKAASDSPAFAGPAAMKGLGVYKRSSRVQAAALLSACRLLSTLPGPSRFR
jgi:hypothetical protein